MAPGDRVPPAGAAIQVEANSRLEPRARRVAREEVALRAIHQPVRTGGGRREWRRRPGPRPAPPASRAVIGCRRGARRAGYKGAGLWRKGSWARALALGCGRLGDAPRAAHCMVVWCPRRLHRRRRRPATPTAACPAAAACAASGPAVWLGHNLQWVDIFLWVPRARPLFERAGCVPREGVREAGGGAAAGSGTRTGSGRWGRGAALCSCDPCGLCSEKPRGASWTWPGRGRATGTGTRRPGPPKMASVAARARHREPVIADLAAVRAAQARACPTSGRRR